MRFVGSAASVEALAEMLHLSNISGFPKSNEPRLINSSSLTGLFVDHSIARIHVPAPRL